MAEKREQLKERMEKVKRRVVQSEVQRRVVNLAIVPRLTKYQQ